MKNPVKAGKIRQIGFGLGG